MTAATSNVTIIPMGRPSVSNFDLETAILAMTMDRIESMDNQLAGMMEKMKNKNQKAANYNLVMQELNKIKNSFANDAKSGDKIPDGGKQYKDSLEKALATAGIKLDKSFDDMTKGEIENAINKVQGLVDENNNTSQMDQLQLQSLISKRNSMFETASTVMKKIIDSLMSIIGNMR